VKQLRKLAIVSIGLLFLAVVNATTILSIPEAKAQGTTLAISQFYRLNQTGTTFMVNVTIKDVAQMGGWNIVLQWNPNITKVSTGDPAGVRKGNPRKPTYYNIYEGDFLKAASTTSFSVNTIDNTGGIIVNLACSFSNVGTYVSGSGTLAKINFTLVNVGTTVLNVTNSIVQDLAGRSIEHDTINGIVTDQPPPVPPPFWIQSWFLTTVAVVLVVTVLPTLLIIRLRSHVKLTPAQIEKIKEYEEEVEGQPLREDSKETSKKDSKS
jgi:hypothetical protein